MKIVNIENRTYIKCDIITIPASKSEVGLPYITENICSWFKIIDKGCRGIITSNEINSPKKWQPQNLYIITDMELHKNDWVLDTTNNNIFQLKEYKKNCKRIIATTDKSLHLPEIETQFIEQYCKFKLKYAYLECDDEYTLGSTMPDIIDNKYYIKIPINIIHLKKENIFHKSLLI